MVTVTSGSGDRVTHRVVAARDGELVLRGDANAAVDPRPYRQQSVDRVVADLPGVGYVVGTVTGPLGLTALTVLVGLLVLLLLRPELMEPPAPGRHRRPVRRRDRRAVVSGGVLVVLVGGSVLGPGQVGPTWAAPWTDAVPVTGASYTAHTVTKPSVISCIVTGTALETKTARIVFAAVSLPHALAYSATIVQTGQALAVVDLGVTRAVDFNSSLLSTVLNQPYDIRLVARLPAPNGAWQSVATTQRVTVTLLGLGVSCGAVA